MYDKISGMTGTADTEAKEFGSIYGLQVVVVPTNRPVIRDDEDDIIFLNEDDKFNAISKEIAAANKRGQPVLVGTISIEKSERLSHALTGLGVKHEVLNAKNHAREALIIAEAGAKGSVTIATNMAGRGTDIKLGGNPEFRARKKSGTEATEQEFRSALEKEMLNWQREYREVQEAGGLYVLGTERHESRRIDNQLRGRSGRQGDPGKSRFFLSLDDDLMRLFGGENFKSMMSKVGMREGEPLFHPWINKAIERAQTRVEDRNYEIRKHLLEYDDVLNEQRKFIYTQRDNILTDNALKNRVFTAAEEIVDEILDTYYEASSSEEEGTFINLAEALNENFFYSLDMSPEEITSSDGEKIKNTILAYLKKDLKEKEEQVGPERLNMFLRVEYLRNIDAKWQDHLENLESLREAVYLRAYGQKNPLLEYKLEGFEIFDKLLEDIRRTIARKIFKIRIENPEASRRAARSGASNLQTNHHVMGQFAAGGEGGGAGSSGGRRGGGPAQAAGPEKVQIKRVQPKVGRNDPCPCGSGKKYKHCCGR
jgi:preprotein translocase subunit SecA